MRASKAFLALERRAFRRAAVFLWMTPFETALSISEKASEMSFSTSARDFSLVSQATRTFLMRVATADLRDCWRLEGVGGVREIKKPRWESS